MRLRKFTITMIGIILMLISMTTVGSANYSNKSSLKVFIKDEGFHEKNIVKPRIYVKNTGKSTINQFDLYYYLTAEGGKTPVIETYYLPSGSVSLKKTGRSEFCVHYRFYNLKLKPGQSFPGKDGFVIGIHYPDWSPMNKSNDYSNPGSPNWRPTDRVKVEFNTNKQFDNHPNNNDKKYYEDDDNYNNNKKNNNDGKYDRDKRPKKKHDDDGDYIDIHIKL